MIRPPLNHREISTVLAALRYWQREGVLSNGHEGSIACDGGDIEPLTGAEIDDLCERINVADEQSADPTIIVVGLDGGLVQGASSNIQGLSMIVVDYDVEGADDDEITQIPQFETVDPVPGIYGLHTVAHDATWVKEVCDACGIKVEQS